MKFGGGETFFIHFLRASAPHFDNQVALFSSSAEFSRELAAIGGATKITELMKLDLGVGKRASYIKLFLYIFAHPFRIISFLKRNNDYDFIVGNGFPFNFVLPVLKLTTFMPRQKDNTTNITA